MKICNVITKINLRPKFIKKGKDNTMFILICYTSP